MAVARLQRLRRLLRHRRHCLHSHHPRSLHRIDLQVRLVRAVEIHLPMVPEMLGVLCSTTKISTLVSLRNKIQYQVSLKFVGNTGPHLKSY